MTIQETGTIMDILAAAYPKFYSSRDVDMKNVMKLWATMFAEDDVRIVAAAVKVLIASDSKGFPPVIGQVKDKIRLLTKKKTMDEAEAWATVKRAIRNSGYEARKEFEALPDEIQRIVGSPNQLRDWAMMDSDTVNSVVASNFQRAFRTRSAARQEYAAIPGDVKKLLRDSGCMMLEDGHSEGDKR